jgi:hypothetical protein
MILSIFPQAAKVLACGFTGAPVTEVGVVPSP